MKEFADLIKSSSSCYEESSILLYQVLFVAFTFFMEQKYTGITRQLMKLFIRGLSREIKEIVCLTESQEIGYLIAIFETFITDAKIKRDNFDLKQMRNILISDENVNKMNLKSSLDGT